MKFEFSFKATPTISCCFPSRPDIEDVMLAIIEKSQVVLQVQLTSLILIGTFEMFCLMNWTLNHKI